MFPDYHFHHLSPQERLKYAGLGAVLAAAVGFAFFQNMILAAFFSVGGLFYPRIVAAGLAKKRKKELLLQFKDALYSLASSLAAGRSLENSFPAVLADLRILYPGEKTAIVQEFAYMCQRLEMMEPIEQILYDFSKRCGLEDVRNFAEVLGIVKRTGGNLITVIQNAAALIGEKIEMEQEMILQLAKQRYEQKILNIMPFVFLGLINFGDSSYMKPLYSSATGYLVFFVALLLLAASYLISQMILDFKY